MLAPSSRRTAVRALVATALLAVPAATGPATAGAAEATGSAVGGPALERAEIDPPGTDAGAADPAALASAEARLVAADARDLWAVADAAVGPIDRLWDAERGAYVVGGVPRARLNAEMLLVHAYAATAGRRGPQAHPERVEALVRLLTGPMYVATLNGQVPPAPAPGHSVTIHAPGFADAAGGLGSMHQALDAVAARALAAAWRARDVVGLSAEARALIRDRVTAVARSPFWRSPSRLLNQINWSADLYAADATVTGDGTLLRRDYRQQLIWFADHARKAAYPGGSPNLGSGFAFHYLPQRSEANLTNRSDTAEYASITLGALAYLDDARRAGMGQLPKRTRDVLRRWTRRVAYGNWTAAGYPNWDTGKGVGRLHLTQYWLLALRGFAAGTQGSTSGGLLPAQVPTTRWVVRRAVELYQRRADAAGSVILPASAFGLTGSSLVTTAFDGLTGTARFASTLAELADRGLGTRGATATPLPDAYAHDADIGRLAVTTGRYSTAFLKPWTPLQVGGLEPARLLDARGRALTGVGGSLDGALGLRVRAGSRVLVETQPGRYRAKQSGLSVPKASRDHADVLRRPLVATGTDSGDGVRVNVRHQAAATFLRTTYEVRNAREGAVRVDLRVPTYGTGSAATLVPGRAVPVATLARGLSVRTPDGARFRVRLRGLPAGTTARVVRVAPQTGNPTPGPSLAVRLTVRGTTTAKLERLLSVPPTR